MSLHIHLYGLKEQGQQPVLMNNNGTGIWGIQGRDTHDWRGDWLGSIPACFSAGEALQKALCTFTSPVLSWRHCVIEGQMTRVSKFVLLHFRFLS